MSIIWAYEALKKICSNFVLNYFHCIHILRTKFEYISLICLKNNNTSNSPVTRL
jgi:hypothetical protein